METRWLNEDELAAWVRLIAVVEWLPGVLDAQLRRDAGLTHFEYYVLAMLSEAPDRTRRMSSLALQTNATLPRLSNVVRRLEDRGLAQRSTPPDDLRASDVRLTDTGWQKVQAAAVGHVANVRANVVDALTAEQVDQLHAIADAILARIRPDGPGGPLPGEGRAETVNIRGEGPDAVR